MEWPGPRLEGRAGGQHMETCAAVQHVTLHREASRTIEQAEVRTRAIDRSLRKVESLPPVQSRGLLEDLTEDATLLVDPPDVRP